MKLRRLLPLLLVGLLLAGCGQTIEPSEESPVQTEGAGNAEADTDNADNEATVGTGTTEESYTLTFTATTTDGETLTSDMFADSKLTMINVWATYCNPCLSEMPDLGEIAASYDKADFQLIGIVSDVAEEDDEATIANAKELIAETKADYPHLLLNESLYMNLVGGVEAVPTTFFVNQKGEPLGYVMGAQSKDVWEEIINDLLGEIE